MDEREDIPGLEEVKYGDAPSIICTIIYAIGVPFLLFCCSLAVFCKLFSFIGWDKNRSFYVSSDTIACIISGIITVLVCWALSSITLYLKTDSKGITSKTRFKTRFIEWHKVRSAETKYKRKLLTGEYVILSDSQMIKFPVMYDIYLDASIWQHLRRVGMADGIELPEEALRLWHNNKIDSQNRIKWSNNNPPKWSKILMRLVIVLLFSALLMYTAYLLNELHKIYSWIISIILLEIMYKSIDSVLAKFLHVSRFDYYDDSFETDSLFGHVVVSWDNVRSAKWYGSAIKMRTSLLGWTIVPYEKTDENSMQLITAIVKRLRNTKKTIIIPFPGIPDNSQTNLADV